MVKKIKNSKKDEITIIKIGTKVITHENGKIDFIILHQLATELAKLKSLQRKFIIVCSGAIGAGMQKLALKMRPKEVIMRQVCASIGQGILMNYINDVFSHYNLLVAQVLISKEVFADKMMKKNMANTLNKLIALDVIPIINENDAISTYEIETNFGDNDLLSKELALFLKVNKIVFLTSVDGVLDIEGHVIHHLKLSHIKMLNLFKKSNLGVGGMQSKLLAAKACTQAGIQTYIGNGKHPDIIKSLFFAPFIGTELILDH